MLFSDGVCRECSGYGEVYVWPEVNGKVIEKRAPCTECHGTGEQLTAIGKELIDFMEKYYDLTLKQKA